MPLDWYSSGISTDYLKYVIIRRFFERKPLYQMMIALYKFCHEPFIKLSPKLNNLNYSKLVAL